MNNHRMWTLLVPYSRLMENCVTRKLQLNVIYSVWIAKFLWFDFLWCDGCAFGDLFIRNCNSTVKLAKTLNHKLKIAIGAKSIWESTLADFVTLLFIHIQCTLHSAQGTTHQLWYSCIKRRKKHVQQTKRQPICAEKWCKCEILPKSKSCHSFKSIGNK